MKIQVYCRGCKNFADYGPNGDGEEVTTCELGRYKEHTQAEKNKWLCECEYWEAKNGY